MMKNLTNKKYMKFPNGLKPIKRDIRDRSFHRTFGGVTPIIFPKEFSVDAGLTMPDQMADGLFQACTAYSQNELCTDQDNVLYDDYENIYRKSLALSNSPFGVGVDMRDSLKTIIMYHNRGAYYAVESEKFDWFDSIRSVMLTNLQVNKIKCSVSIGTPWFKEFDVTSVGSDGIVSEVFTGDPYTLSWHNWAIKGWTEVNGIPYLIAKTWQGKLVGKQGWYLYPRETINAVMAIKGTGAYTVAPRNADNVQTVKATFIESLVRLYKLLVSKLLTQQVSTPVPVVVPEVVKPISVPTVEELKWGNPTEARHSVRVICDLQALKLAEKNLICAVIMGESEFYNYLPSGKPTIHENRRKDGSLSSTDWGICQINDYWHIGPKKTFPSVDYLMANPQKAVEFMIQMYKAGNLKLWIAYSSGAYKKYL
jgi:hypothetical protein